MSRVQDTQAMIAGMTPQLMPGRFHFCRLDVEDERLTDLTAQALATFREVEAMTLILSEPVAKSSGLAEDQPMCQITLGVHSSLEGVGLTAAVATALEREGIACNMVAAYHHDHVFVPANRAVSCLEALARRHV